MFYFNPGELRHKITFRTLTEGENEVSETTLEPQDFKTVWAAIEPLKGREYEEAKKLRTELTYKITIRYTSNITPDMKIRFGARVFEIIDIINLEERNIILQITAYEKEDERGNGT